MRVVPIAHMCSKRQVAEQSFQLLHPVYRQSLSPLQWTPTLQNLVSFQPRSLTNVCVTDTWHGTALSSPTAGFPQLLAMSFTFTNDRNDSKRLLICQFVKSFKT